MVVRTRGQSDYFNYFSPFSANESKRRVNNLRTVIT